jgi:hypothetical protein
MRNLALAVLVLGLAIVPRARADIPPLPGEQERYLARVIEAANYPCGKVSSFKSATGSDADDEAKEGLDPFVASCSNGKTYFVAVPRRRVGAPPLDPSGKPIPYSYPDPVVKELAQ